MNQRLNHGLHALSDPTRLAILQSLALRPSAVSELADCFPISRPAISQHLKVLKLAGLVTDRALGTQRIYQIDAKGIAALKLHFDQLWSCVLDNFKAAAEVLADPAAATPSPAPSTPDALVPAHDHAKPKPRQRRRS